MDYEQFFRKHYGLIKAVMTQVCRRCHASVDEEEEFCSEMNLKLIEKDYAVLRRYKGEASLRAFLTTVILNAFRDFRIRRWGKFRPSEAAKEHGDVGMLLERLIVRDGYSFDAAVEILRTNYKIDISRDELWAMYMTFPPRLNRRTESTDEIEVPDGAPSPEASLEAAHMARRRAHAYVVLLRGLRKASEKTSAGVPEFTDRERLMIYLRFFRGWKLVDIARRLGEPEKGFHARFQQLLAHLRRWLEKHGIDPRDLGL